MTGASQNFIALIKVVGVGGAGVNAVNRMIEAGLKGVEFIAVNTDGQALRASRAGLRIQLITANGRGKALGAGCDPEAANKAALDRTEELIEVLNPGGQVGHEEIVQFMLGTQRLSSIQERVARLEEEFIVHRRTRE